MLTISHLTQLRLSKIKRYKTVFAQVIWREALMAWTLMRRTIYLWRIGGQAFWRCLVQKEGALTLASSALFLRSVTSTSRREQKKCMSQSMTPMDCGSLSGSGQANCSIVTPCHYRRTIHWRGHRQLCDYCQDSS